MYMQQTASELPAPTDPAADPSDAAAAATELPEPAWAAPPAPRTLEDTGLSEAFVSGLLLKTLYVEGGRTGEKLSDRLCLPFAILDDLILKLQHRRFVEVRGTQGHSRGFYVFDLTTEGRLRAREIMQSNGYVGPAPVPSETYRHWVAVQSVREDPLPRERIHEGLSHLVLDEAFIDRLGPGINSGRSVFLYGEPGNGKTEIAFAVSKIMGRAIYMPHAVEIDGQIVRIHDPLVHESMEDEIDDDAVHSLFIEKPAHDRRFARVRRPSVVVGGELTLDELELQPSQQPGVYTAPPQMKANGGVFVIDDFGRQRVRPRDLLNRWMIPLDRGSDFLALPNGSKIEIPFDVLVFFATNLNPHDLVEEAFLRRIRYKIEMPNPTREQYAEILRRACARRGIEYADFAVDAIYEAFYEGKGLEPRSCHPGDLISDLCDAAHYRGVEPTLTPELLYTACSSYFIEPMRPAAGPPGGEEVARDA